MHGTTFIRKGSSGGANPISLWDFLVGICFLVPIFSAFDRARAMGAGIVGYVLALTIGLGVGVGFGCSLYALHKGLVRLYREEFGVLFSLVFLVALLIVELGWIGAALLAGEATTTPVVRWLY